MMRLYRTSLTIDILFEICIELALEPWFLALRICRWFRGREWWYPYIMKNTCPAALSSSGYQLRACLLCYHSTKRYSCFHFYSLGFQIQYLPLQSLLLQSPLHFPLFHSLQSHHLIDQSLIVWDSTSCLLLLHLQIDWCWCSWIRWLLAFTHL